MSAVTETAVIALGVNGALSTGALVYVVRRVTPWPKPPAQQLRIAAPPKEAQTEPAQPPAAGGAR